MPSFPNRLRISFLLLGLSGPLAQAAPPVVTGFGPVDHGGRTTFRIQWGELRNPDVDFQILDEQGVPLSLAAGGSISRGAGASSDRTPDFQYVAPRGTVPHRVVIRVRTRTIPAEETTFTIQVGGHAPGGPKRKEVEDALPEGRKRAKTDPADGPGLAPRPSGAVLSPLPSEILGLIAEYADESFEHGDFRNVNTGRVPFSDILSASRQTVLNPEAEAPGADRIVGEMGSASFFYSLPRYADEAVPPCLSVPYGLPVPLPVRPWVADHFLFSYVDEYSGEPSRREFGAGTGLEVLRFSGHLGAPALLESGRRLRETWILDQASIPIRTRGLVPLAGVPGRSDVVDGAGFKAACQGPYGLARGHAPAFPDTIPAFLHRNNLRQPLPHIEPQTTWFTEPESHVIRCISKDHAVAETVCGMPGERGFRDGARKEARFDGPTFLLCKPTWEGEVENLLVSDTGNNAIREIDMLSGQVRTLARDLPQPRGLDFRGGELIVAVQGQHQILCTGSDGQNRRVLAGSGVQGARDGEPSLAEFTDLKGLVVDIHDPLLEDPPVYCIDGNAVRMVTEEAVTTLAGSVTEEGFQDGTAATLPPGTACFRNPIGIAIRNRKLFIADTGNHAIRVFDLEARTLKTLAGDPKRPGIAWGLLRDDLPVLPEKDYGTLEAPRGLCFRDYGTEDLSFTERPVSPTERLTVATGTCIAELHGLFAAKEPGLTLETELAAGGVPEGGAPERPFRFRMQFGETALVPGVAYPFDFHYWVDFRHLDHVDRTGASEAMVLRTSERAQGRLGEWIDPPADLFRSGRAGTVTVRCVTNRGFTYSRTFEVAGVGPVPEPKEAKDGRSAL